MKDNAKVLAIVTEEEADKLAEINARVQASLLMMNQIRDQIAEDGTAQGNWFTEMKEKYGLSGDVHFNMPTREIREGRS
jgi:hypothetical protein